MAAKTVTLKRKIGSDIFEMMPKTTAGQVVVSYGDCVDLASALTKVYTDVEAWNTFKANVDFAGQDAALDTLRELIDMINKEEQAGSIANSLKKINDAITTLQQKDTAIDGEIADLKAKDTALDGEIAALKEKDTAIDGEIANLKAKDTEINGEITAIKDAATALTGRVTTAEGDIDALEEAVANINGGASFIYSGTEVPENLTERDLFIEITG